jgi:hypothetical protein
MNARVDPAVNRWLRVLRPTKDLARCTSALGSKFADCRITTMVPTPGSSADYYRAEARRLRSEAERLAQGPIPAKMLAIALCYERLVEMAEVIYRDSSSAAPIPPGDQKTCPGSGGGFVLDRRIEQLEAATGRRRSD